MFCGLDMVIDTSVRESSAVATVVEATYLLEVGDIGFNARSSFFSRAFNMSAKPIATDVIAIRMVRFSRRDLAGDISVTNSRTNNTTPYPTVQP